MPRIIDSVAVATEIALLSVVSGLLSLAFLVWMLLNAMKALNELRNAAGNPSFPRWPIFIPIYNWIYWITMVPKQVQQAKQMRGLQPTTKNVALYFFVPVFALQSDLNELAGP